MDRVGIPRDVFIFERKLNKECYSYGWGRGLTRACNLYGNNLHMKDYIFNLQNENERLKKILNDNNIIFEDNSLKLELESDEGYFSDSD